jgi:hypothetical protein
MSTLFSAPKVQISRVVDKYLSDAPSADTQQLGVFREQSEVVSALVCFADHLLETGTAAEYAEKLGHCMQQEADERKIAWQQEVENKRRRYVSCLFVHSHMLQDFSFTTFAQCFVPYLSVSLDHSPHLLLYVMSEC